MRTGSAKHRAEKPATARMTRARRRKANGWILIRSILVMVFIALVVPAPLFVWPAPLPWREALPSFERPRETEILLRFHVLRLQVKCRLIVGNGSLIFTQSDKQIAEFLMRQGGQGLIWFHRKAVLEVGSRFL